ncbi:PAS domain S-box protein [Haloarchaeobius amylolyticus]|uniref:PAS domain S-box protein n=1 Tax=Haloarchaeobius amylolyticus TaxID=1198296 RepID=UPI00226F00FA
MVLVVAEDEALRSRCVEYLSDATQFSVVAAATADEVDEVLDASAEVACIACDFHLPGETALDLLDSLHERGWNRPVVVLTPPDDTAAASEALEAGADDFIERPTTETDCRFLANRMENLLEHDAAESELAREEDRFQTLIEASTDLVAVLDEEGRYQYLSPAVEHVFGYSVDDLLGEDGFSRVHPDDREELVAVFQELITSDDDAVQSVEYRYRTGDGDYRWYESTGRNRRQSAIGGYVVNTRDITERKQRIDSLRTLNETLHDMIRDGGASPLDDDDATRAAEITGGTNAAYYEWRTDDGVLEHECDTWSAALPETLDEASTLWETFVAGEADRVESADDGADELAGDEDAYLLFPIDREGLLVCATTGTFSEFAFSLGQMLAAGYEAVFERGRFEDALREREAELREANDELARLNQLNDVIRNVDKALVRSTDEQAIAQAVCAELTAASFVGHAWFGVPTGDGGVEVLDYDGGDSEFVSRVTELVTSADDAPAAVAMRTQEPVVVSSILDESSCSEIRQSALRRGYRGLVSIPVTHRNTVYGVLEVYLTGPDIVNETSVEVLSELGDTIGYASSAIERRRGGVGLEVVEVAIELDDVEDVVTSLAVASDCSAVVTDLVGQADRWLVYVEPSDPEAFAAVANERLSVTNVERVDDDELELTVDQFQPGEILSEYAGTFVRYEVGPEYATLTAQLPAQFDIRSLVEDLQSLSSRVQLVRKEHVTDDPENGMRLLSASLTDRQTEVLKVAFNRGYFNWPRDSTGEEIAAALGISPPTFHQHLRKALLRLLRSCLSGKPTDS